MLVSFNLYTTTTTTTKFWILNLLSIQNSNKVSCGLLASDSEHHPNRLLVLGHSAPHRYLIELPKNDESDLTIHLLRTFLSPVLPTGLKAIGGLAKQHPSQPGFNEKPLIFRW